jgi:hypothetical protein
MDTNGLIIGIIFGAALFLSGLANPDKIIGTLRLKDLHAMRVIILFVVIAMLGIWILADFFNIQNFSIKPAYLLTNLLGGTLLGIGFGLTGYCPGTGLACAAAGRIDALITVLGMFLGALAYILIYPSVIVPLESIPALDLGKATLPQITGIPRFVWALCIAGLGIVAAFLTVAHKPKEQQT